MKTRFQSRWNHWLLALVWVSLCAGCLAAQLPATNATVPKAERPAVSELASELSFGLDRVPWLGGRLFEIPLWQYLNLQIKERFGREGIEFAFPSQTHYVKRVD